MRDAACDPCVCVLFNSLDPACITLRVPINESISRYRSQDQVELRRHSSRRFIHTIKADQPNQ
jgi:hypothetical protein